MVYFDGDAVLSGRQVFGQLILKRDEPIGTFAQRMTVDPDFAVIIDPIEVNIHVLAFLHGRDLECFAVPADASRQISGAAGPLLIEGD